MGVGRLPCCDVVAKIEYCNAIGTSMISPAGVWPERQNEADPDLLIGTGRNGSQCAEHRGATFHNPDEWLVRNDMASLEHASVSASAVAGVADVVLELAGFDGGGFRRPIGHKFPHRHSSVRSTTAALACLLAGYIAKKNRHLAAVAAAGREVP